MNIPVNLELADLPMLSDWYEEQGDIRRAEACRVIVTNGWKPLQLSWGYKPFVWLNHASWGVMNTSPYRTASLPPEVFGHLVHRIPVTTDAPIPVGSEARVGSARYDTSRDAYLDLIDALIVEEPNGTTG